MTSGSPFDLEPGQWTDDSSLALCLAESLVIKQGFDARNQLERYVRWYRERQRAGHSAEADQTDHPAR